MVGPVERHERAGGLGLPTFPAQLPLYLFPGAPPAPQIWGVMVGWS
jgi:hypothetical protein